MPQGWVSPDADNPQGLPVYTRRSVEEIEEFEGWQKVVERQEKIEKERGFDLAQVHGAAFLTGGRITETLTLKPEHFTPKIEVVALPTGKTMTRRVLEVKGMLLEKHWKKEDSWTEKVPESKLPQNALRRLFSQISGEMIDGEQAYARVRFHTKRLVEHRKPFDIPLDEVPKELRKLHIDLQAHIRQMQGQEWLFPSHTRHTRMSRSYAWDVMKDYGIFNHYLRGQRASCLITWNGLAVEQMMEWMSWENFETAMHYGKMGKSKLLGVFRRFK